MKKTILSVMAIVAIGIAFFIYSCNKEASSNQINGNNLKVATVSKRLELIKRYGDDKTNLKNEFGKLSSADKMAIWLDKLNSLSNQDLPTEHKSLIISLTTELQKEQRDVATVSTYAIKLAKITPEEDFNKMFAEIEDYKYSGRFIGTTPVNESILKDLGDLSNYGGLVYSGSSDVIDPKLPDCNCRWTCEGCSGGGQGDIGTKCNKTFNGCGFLWLTYCNCYSIIRPLNTTYSSHF